MRAWAILGLAITVAATVARAADWTPTAWADEGTVELRTDCPGEGEYWFPVWLTVLDGQLYVRLGRRSAQRVACTASAPFLGVRIAGAEFDRVRMTPSPELADRVAAALHQKYWFDVAVQYVNHPLTLKLTAE